MSASTVTVSYSDGSPARGVRVQLSFSSGGMSQEALADSSGRAVISHDGSGRAKLYVNGRHEPDGDFNAPGATAVSIRR